MNNKVVNNNHYEINIEIYYLKKYKLTCCQKL